MAGFAPEGAQPQPEQAGPIAPEGAPSGGMQPQSAPQDLQTLGHELDQEIVAGLEAHLDQIPDDQKAFLAEHLTQEFVRAIGIINGPEVANYLSQFVDNSIVLVPVPRQVAEEHLAQMQAQQAAPTEAPQPAPQGQPEGGGMAPQPLPQ